MSTVQIQIPDSLHKSLRHLAERDGISIDQFIATSVAEKIAALLTSEYLDARASHGARAAYDVVLAKASESEPEPFDKLTD
jgi:hypothetical protein